MRLFLAALLLCVLPLAVQAKPVHRAPVTKFAGDRYTARTYAAMAGDVVQAVRKQRAGKAKRTGRQTKLARRHSRTMAPLTLAQGIAREGSVAAVTIISGRPAGCPHQFCGCGASLHLFGRIIPALNLAANWLRFPRADPAPNMVAARRGHVFVLKQHIAGKTWLVFDANSGGHRTRIHPRSIAGYAIVNPSRS